MVPKTLHEGNLILDFLDLDLRSFDSGGVLEFLGIVSQLGGFVDFFFDLTIDILKAAKSGVTSSVVAIEVTFLHTNDVLLQVFFVFGNHVHVFLALSLAKRSDLLLGFLGKFLKAGPLGEGLGSLLYFLVL